MAEHGPHPLLSVRRTEIEALHTLFELPLPAQPLWSDFAAELVGLCELSYGVGLDSLGVMTRGVGASFLDRLQRRLEGLLGAERAELELAHLQAALHAVGGALFVKVDYDTAGLNELSWYSTGPRAPADAVSLLAGQGVGRSQAERLARVWRSAGAEQVYVGRALRAAGRGGWATYAPLGNTWTASGSAALYGVLRRAAVPPLQRDLVRLHHAHLIGNDQRRVFVGLGVPDAPDEGEGLGLKLDWEAPLPEVVDHLLADLGLDAEHRAALAAVGQLLSSPRPSYLGLRLGPGGARVKLYLGRFPALAALPV